MDPLYVVGWEGFWGVLEWVIILPLLQLVNCFGKNLCPYGKLEDTLRAFDDYGANWELIIQSIGICVSVALFNVFGVFVTKNASGA